MIKKILFLILIYFMISLASASNIEINNSNWDEQVSLNNTVEDWGDHTIKIGIFADNFEDGNLNGWSTASADIVTTIHGNSAYIATNKTLVLNTSNYIIPDNVSYSYYVNYTKTGDTYAKFQVADSVSTQGVLTAFHDDEYKYYVGGYSTIYDSSINIWYSLINIMNMSSDIMIYYLDNVYINSSALRNNIDDIDTITHTVTTGYANEHYIDNIWMYNPELLSGEIITISQDAGSDNVFKKLKHNSEVMSNTSIDIYINSSNDNSSWNGWELVQENAANDTFYNISESSQKRYAIVKYVLNTLNSNITLSVISLTSQHDIDLEPTYNIVWESETATSINFTLSNYSAGLPIFNIWWYRGWNGTENISTLYYSNGTSTGFTNTSYSNNYAVIIPDSLLAEGSYYIEEVSSWSAAAGSIFAGIINTIYYNGTVTYSETPTQSSINLSAVFEPRMEVL